MVGKTGVFSWIKWGVIKNYLYINISSQYIIYNYTKHAYKNYLKKKNFKFMVECNPG